MAMRSAIVRQSGLLRVVRIARGRTSPVGTRKKDNVGGQPAKRGKVTSFSRKSRKRMLDIVASLRKTATRKTVFITLTYGQEWPHPDEAKRHLDAFLKRVARKFPKASGIWRMDAQERGAPHFHFLFFRMPFWDKKELQTAWHEIVGDKYSDFSSGTIKEPFTRIELVKSRKGAFWYVGKYSANISGFNYVPYLTGLDSVIERESQAIKEIGRQWGIHNREHMPFAPIEWAYVSYEGFRAIQRWYKFVMCKEIEYPNSGFSIYLEPEYVMNVYKHFAQRFEASLDMGYG